MPSRTARRRLACVPPRRGAGSPPPTSRGTGRVPATPARCHAEMCDAAAVRRCSTPSSRIVPDAARTKPLIVFSSVDLPLPLAPRSATTSPADTSRSTPNRIWSVAVAGLDAARGQQCGQACPRYASSTARSARTCSGGASATFWPSFSTITRSATLITSSIACSISHRDAIFRVRADRGSHPQDARAPPARGPTAGSSSSSSGGLVASARTISTMRCWPPESAPAFGPRRLDAHHRQQVARPRCSPTIPQPLTAGRTTDRKNRCQPARAIRPARSPVRSVRETARRSGTCGVRHAAEISCGVSPAISSPRNRMLPPSATTLPDTALNSVVLPAPFGPISAQTSPAADRTRRLLDGDQATEAHRDIEQGQQRRISHDSNARRMPGAAARAGWRVRVAGTG